MRKIGLLTIALLLVTSAAAQEVTLRLHHFLADTSPVHEGYLAPWAQRVEEQSDGRIEVQIYPSMQLGGAAPSLIDQAADGVVDLVWTLPGYTAGRFPVSEAFELPFMSGYAEHSSPALCEFYFEYLQDEYADVHVITLHTAGSGLLHMNGGTVRSIDDLRGKQVRAPNRIMTEALGLLGAEAIGMPVPEVPESLSRGVIDGTLLPWEVTAPLRVAELVDSHTGFGSDRGIYTSTFLLAMNPESYASLAPDLQGVIDANSIHGGCEESRIAGANMDRADIPGRELAEQQGNEIYMIPAEEVVAWQEALQPLHEQWVEQMNDRGLDGDAMLKRARELIADYEALFDAAVEQE